MNIMVLTSDDKKFSQHRYFIDCPVDVEMFEAEVRRIEIPRELAKYINNLQRQIEQLKTAPIDSQ